MNQLLSQFFKSPDGSAVEVALSHEGLGVGWAVLLALILGAAAILAYRWGAPNLKRSRRGLLATLRVICIIIFLILVVRPILMLTIHEPIRERLLVLIDGSQSMQITDRRTDGKDQERARIAAGGGGDTNNISRANLLKALSTNTKLRLWPRLQEKADLSFYEFSGAPSPLGMPQVTADAAKDSPILDEVKGIFDRETFDGDTTALGDSLLQVLEENRGQPITGVMIISDGANNTGVPPDEIAAQAGQEGIPLFVYGIGITAPKDVFVEELTGPRGAFMKENAEFTVKVKASGYAGQTAMLQLKADGLVVKEQQITFGVDGSNEYKIAFEPQAKGNVNIEASIEPRGDESAMDNNAASAKLRVLDSKVKVLYLEQEPRWDFRYLLATLRRDRRLDVKCVLFDGDAVDPNDKETPFLTGFPEDRAAVVENEIIIMGDVDPKELGETRMKLINEWVGEMGGGLIFLAGRNHNPVDYANSPLEPLLPVEVDPSIPKERWSERAEDPIKLKLTPVGELSPLFRLDENPSRNRQIWDAFPGVNWTARVIRARPSAQTFLEDSTPANANRNGLMPVIAQHTYGQGQVMYFGFDETYRWRSKVGQEYYTRIWNQVIQSFSLERQLGASTRSQLKSDKAVYYAGDKVIISGKVLGEDFRPVLDPSVRGTLQRRQTLEGNPEESALNLASIPDQPGSYEVEFEVKQAGFYSYSTILDPKAAVKFEVVDPQIEMGETAMNEATLKNMANLSNGVFMREEDLDKLPDLVSSRSSTLPTYKKLELYYSPWWIVALITFIALEWLLRRVWQLR